jgi:hypothetical protein
MEDCSIPSDSNPQIKKNLNRVSHASRKTSALITT